MRQFRDVSGRANNGLVGNYVGLVAMAGPFCSCQCYRPSASKRGVKCGNVSAAKSVGADAIDDF